MRHIKWPGVSGSWFDVLLNVLKLLFTKLRNFPQFYSPDFFAGHGFGAAFGFYVHVARGGINFF
jgi:hypothetical protein